MPATAFQNYVEVTTPTATREVHLIPEAVFHDPETERKSTYVCSHCAKAEKKAVFDAGAAGMAPGSPLPRRHNTQRPRGTLDHSEFAT